MNPRVFRSWVVWLLTGIALAGFSPDWSVLVCAQDTAKADAAVEGEGEGEGEAAEEATEPEIDDKVWREERKKVEALIQARIESETTKAVVKRDIANQLNFGWPVKPPLKTLKELEADISKKIDQMVAAKYPDETAKYQKEAEDKYKLYQKGDAVIPFIIRGGVGPNTQVTGRYRALNDERIQIGIRTVLRSDVNDEDQARFYPEVNKKYVERYVRVQSIKADTLRRNLENELRSTMLPDAYVEAGYIPKKRQNARSPKTDDWISKSEALDLVYDRRREDFIQKTTPQVEQELYTQSGYTFVKEQNEWMPKKAAESFWDKLKKKMAAKQKEAEAKPEEAKAAQDLFPGQAGAPGAPPPGEMMPGMAPGAPGMAPGAPGAPPPGEMMPGMAPGAPGMAPGGPGAPGVPPEAPGAANKPGAKPGGGMFDEKQ